MKETIVGHITIADELSVTASPTYGPSGYTATATATKSDGSAVTNIGGWLFHPDSAPSTYTQVCGAVNPCVFHPTTSGKIEIHALIGNQWKQKRAHVTVVPCPTGDSLLDTPALRDGLQYLVQLSHMGDPTRGTEHGGWLYRNPNTGEFFHVEYVSIQDACSFAPPDYVIDYPPEWRVGMTHSHPFGKGESFNGRCISTGGRPGMGGPQGPSLADDSSAVEHGLPSYIVDKDSVYRTNGPGQHQSWPRSLNGCLLFPPPDPTLERLRAGGPMLRARRANENFTGVR